MKSVDVVEAGQTLNALIDEAERGETVVITRDGRPVAHLLAGAGASMALGVAKVRAEHRISMDGASIDEFKNEGRK